MYIVQKFWVAFLQEKLVYFEWWDYAKILHANFKNKTLYALALFLQAFC